MKQVYWSHTPLGGDYRAQSLDVSLVVNIGGSTYRVTLHWDRSYSFQSRGEVAVFKGGEFKPVLALFHHDMTHFADFDRRDPPWRGDFERAGKLPALLRQQAESLAELGSRITGA